MGSSNGKMHGILSSILAENAMTRTNGRVASDRTTTAYGEVLRMGFDVLHNLGFRLENPRNLNETHIKVLCEHWYSEGKAVSTIQDYLSKFRVFSGWVDKKGMVKSLPHYLPHVPANKLQVKTAAVESKGWSENGVDIAKKIEQADALDMRFGLMLRMMLAFGLRRKEVVHTRVWKADNGDKLRIYIGEAKGGRPRDIHIDNHEQRIVLDYVKSKVAKGEHLGWRTKRDGTAADLEYNVTRYNRLMAKIGITKLKDGVTGHGLRAQYAENSALIAQMIPPTLGGTGNQMAKDDLELKLARVSELLGHSRPSITSAYYGKFGKDRPQDLLKIFQNNIKSGLQQLNGEALTAVPDERKNDCMALVMEMAEFEVDVTLRQVHRLWAEHSKRFATDWASLQKSNIGSLEVAAMKLSRPNGFSA